MRSKPFAITKVIFALMLIFSLLTCTVSKINQVEDKWGPPAKIEKSDGNKIYYWYFQKAQASKLWNKVSFSEGWVTYEFTVDESGTIIHKRKYWKQPE